MIQQPAAIFLVNLIQDVTILRPLVIMAARDFGFDTRILVSTKFRRRDLFGIWEAELEALRQETGARIILYNSDLDAFRELDGTGIIFSASESNVPEHSAAHAVFRYAPPTFLKVTVQHGFECVGFRHSAAHDRAYGKQVSFAADIVCAWQPAALEPALPLSQRAKLQVTGPTAALQTFNGPINRDGRRRGLVCENLHSVRLRSSENLGRQFLSTFEHFCAQMAEDGSEVVLRPHPGGQYVLKHGVELPSNVEINNAPMYRLDLRKFSYGISAPSSVLVDLLCADVPTAIWRDSNGDIDTSNYPGITQVSNAGDWREFAREAIADPKPFIRLQRQFLADQQMPIDPADVFARYARIFQAAERMSVRSRSVSVDKHRLLVVANAHLPTVQVCLERPLTQLVQSGVLAMTLLTESRLKQVSARIGPEHMRGWINQALDQFDPGVVMFSRYSGPFSFMIVDWARERSVPIIYHIDDDLLGVPLSLGERKHAYHNAPERISAVRSLLQSADLVYASTEVLRQRLLGYFPGLNIVAGRINASGYAMREPRPGRARKIGYVASADHLPNLSMILPVIEGVLDRNADLSFELFGSIPIPSVLDRFGDRITRIEPIADYEEFLEALCEREWDIGVCPLTGTDFNRTKSNNKWIEYTAAGIAVVASSGMAYDQCCLGGAGFLASNLDEWQSAIDRLIVDDAERVAMVKRAQQRLESDYGIAAHRQQIIDIVQFATEQAARSLVRENA